jgi:hypothetical protein
VQEIEHEGADAPTRRPVRIAAAGDVHCRPGMEDRLRKSFAEVAERADLILLAGDLTTHGDPPRRRSWPTPAATSTCRSSPCSETTTGTSIAPTR